MTGYAQGRKEQDGWAVRVSVKSVNHRFRDLKLRMPEGFDFYELRLRQMVRERIHRGHLDVHVYVEPGTAAPVQVNKEVAKAYLRAAEVLRQETSAAASVDVVSLLRLPGVITGVSGAMPETEEEQERIMVVLEGCLREVLAKLMICGVPKASICPKAPRTIVAYQRAHRRGVAGRRDAASGICARLKRGEELLGGTTRGILRGCAGGRPACGTQRYQ